MSMQPVARLPSPVSFSSWPDNKLWQCYVAGSEKLRRFP